MNKTRIYLTGFMGAGKSTLGKIIANVLGWTFVDLDREIERKNGMRIAALFKQYGEAAFRRMEGEALIHCSAKPNLVAALGGGAILDEGNLLFIRENGILIYLKSEPEHIYYRLRNKMDRPLFQTMDGEAMTKETALMKINELLKTRAPLYEQADIIFESDRQSVGRAADRLVRLLEKKYNIR
jgi:shikimate kinase